MQLSWDSLGNPKQLDEPLLVVDRSDLGTQDPVQDLGDGESQREGDDHEHLGQPDGVRADGQPVTGANGLKIERAFKPGFELITFTVAEDYRSNEFQNKPSLTNFLN